MDNTSLCFGKIARQLKDVLINSTTENREHLSDDDAARVCIMCEMFFDQLARQTEECEVSDFHYFLDQMLPLYAPEFSSMRLHAVVSPKTLREASRFMPDATDIEVGRTVLEDLGKIYINTPGSGFSVGTNWWLDGLILSARHNAYEIWALFRSAATGNLHRVHWIAFGQTTGCTIDNTRPVVTPQMQRFFDVMPEESSDMATEIAKYPGGISDLKTQIEIIGLALSAWVYYGWMQKGRVTFATSKTYDLIKIKPAKRPRELNLAV